MKGIKVLGLAALTALALTVCTGVASAAPAGYWEAEAVPESVKSTIPGGAENRLSTVLGVSICNPILTGTFNSVTSSTLNASANNFCKATPSTELNMNGCVLIIHPPSEGNIGTVDIGGAECKGISGIQAFTKMTVPAQNGLAATFKNEGAGSSAKVQVRLKTNALKYEVTSGPQAGTYTNGSYDVTWLLSGEYAGKAAGINVYYTPGFSFSSGKFRSEFYPATIVGEQINGVVGGEEFPKLFLATGAGTLKCIPVTFASPSPITNDSSEAVVSPTFKNCLLNGLSATVTPEAGCVYRMKGSGELSSCGLEIVQGTCKVTVSSQSHSGMEYLNKGTGTTAYVEAKLNISALQYQVAGSKCPKEKAPGSYSDGTYKGVVKLSVAP